MSKFYNVIASEKSRNAYGGHGKINLLLLDEKEIINLAQTAARREGYDLEHYAGIGLVGVGKPDEDGDYEQYKHERNWNDGEELQAAVDYWTRDGYIYEIFESGKQDDEFVQRASEFSLEDEAAGHVMWGGLFTT